MVPPIQHPREPDSNAGRTELARVEPHSLRTFTPTQAVLSASAGIYHWTPEGRRLYDFTSGVLVSNLGHNPSAWTRAYFRYMGWPALNGSTTPLPHPAPAGYFPAVPMTAYNAVTPVEVQASARLIELMRSAPGGNRMEQVLWAASGSEAIQKALWAALARDRSRPMIIATRHGFHGKKGLSNAVTGSETDAERDPRVKFISFPMAECRDISLRGQPFDFTPYQKELDALRHQYGMKLGTLITEPYLGGGGSYHPPKEYLQGLERFCREHDIVFIIDEVQANFGRTGAMFAFETYGLEPDIVVLGKGLGNGIPVAAAVGKTDIFDSLGYGEASDTWSANPLCCAAVQATLDAFERADVLGQMKPSSAIIERGLVALKELPFVANVRGEDGGMVWGVEMRDFAERTAAEWANALVLACYQGDGSESDGIHLLGPLAKKVVRVSPPLVITPDEAHTAVTLMLRSARRMTA
ncbi:Acetylornithine aminotransferase [Gemmata obscuriglobus]|uniref:Aspartate aminotransferase family protein n=2 Tax=Gemmata obscuriglobus TaxID=114 RepID=A0A2Z3H3C2_9BACT|nr:aspartate aminotransferase family protein [Gemmata obscuriglobus]QEG29047.1 Acetylornithine aminotransferase [Gemmata obscuriglobus]VTS07669.1 acetylornithine aminotransferase : 4-aminobutyrate aminotransferase OS=Planctomyces maris DSM 8797 GN=PM8797T_18644 PE=3 SV=1: Aminotran_3 [Gemmata obscuriglobus UQM 2246]